MPASQPLKELGIDSLMAVEVRNQLSVHAETKLPATLVFDYPTPEAIAKLLLTQAFAQLVDVSPRVEAKPLMSDEPIAVLAIGCRAPGGVEDPEAYWQLLDEGRDAIGPFPSRWDVDTLYDPDPDARGKTYVRSGGFLRDVDRFDAGFFGIAPREALAMDPQQRVVLETTWEALERAGIRPEALNETVTGVYLGSVGADYSQVCMPGQGGDGYLATGQAASVISGRVSYSLGLLGPALTVDTACSSSLVALHLACAGLRQGECDLALAGGVQVMSTPAQFLEFSRLRALSPEGRCKAFSADADGTAWGEGCGVLVLKRLADAQRDGDRVLAVLRGSAVNQDGRSQGLTAPNGPSQQRAIRLALSASKLVPDDIDAVEAHGTGTPLGDPIEATALAAVFGPSRADKAPVYLGSSKSNIGHTTASAGVLGVIKMVLALTHERLPPTLHAQQPSSQIEWEQSGLSLLQEARAWPRRADRVRRAGVSSFGFSGTNAHLIVEEAPLGTSRATPAVLPAVPLLLSARDEGAMREQAKRWASWLEQHPSTAYADVLRTASARTAFGARAALFAADTQEAIGKLRALADGRPHADLVVGKASALGAVVFVFPGQGSQWAGMGCALWDESAVFREAVLACDAAFLPHTGWSVAAVLRGETLGIPPVTRVDVVQPALFTMGVALAAVWRSLGVEPAVVVGTSQGEVAAAVVAGALSLADGARIAALRSQLLLPLAGTGGMAVVQLPVDEVEQLLARQHSALSVAGVNTPDSTLVSGESAAIDTFVASREKHGIFCRRIDVDYASHSAQMDGLLEELRAKLADLRPRDSQVPMVSTLLGAEVLGHELTADYWCRNLREPVRLDRALEVLTQRRQNVFVEVSAHPVLAMPLTTACTGGAGAVVGTLSRDVGSLGSFYRALATLHVQGHAVAWEARIEGKGYADLPTYAFQRQRYWVEAQRAASDLPSLGLSGTEHPVLRVQASLPDGGVLLSGRLSLAEQAWVSDHRVFETVLFPGTGFVEFALAAGASVGCPTVRDLVIAAPLTLVDKLGVQVQLQLEAADSQGQRAFKLHSRSEENEQAPWLLHATGLLATSSEPFTAPLNEFPPAGATPVDLVDLYPRLAASGLRYGPVFQGVRAGWRVGDTLYAEVSLPAPAAEQAADYGIHPALFDAALHLFARGASDATSGTTLLPFSWSEVSLHSVGARTLRVRLELSAASADQASATLVAFDELGQPVVSVGCLQARRATTEQVRAAARSSTQDLYRIHFQPISLPEPLASERALVVGGSAALAKALQLGHVADLHALLARLDAGELAPERLIFDRTSGRNANGRAHAEREVPLPRAAREATESALTELQVLLTEPRLLETRCVWVTSGAVNSAPEDGVADLVHAPLWGLLRSARGERPERVLRVVDMESSALSAVPLRQLLAADTESELVWRRGRACASRLVVAESADRDVTDEQTASSLDTAGTVVITGGLGEIGQTLARHLVVQHGIRHLLLTSRRGADTPGATELASSLASLGAESVRIVACDVADRQQLADALSEVDARHPLTGVFHLAGVLDDGVVTELSAERLERVMRPKVDGAFHLHELTKGLNLPVFVLFSSMAGVLGGNGQANYAAANTFLDALAAERQRQGLRAQSLAWGLWQPQGVGLTARLSAVDLSRMRRAGIAPITFTRGMELLDMCLSLRVTLLVPARLELAKMQHAYADQAEVPALLRGLVRPSPRRAQAGSAAGSSLRARLSGLPASERLASLVTLVQEVVAAVTGMAAPTAVPPKRPLKDLGLDSLMGLEIRNRLSARVEAALPATLVFDYPTPSAIAGLLAEKLGTKQAATWSDAEVRAKLSKISITALAELGVLDTLMGQPDELQTVEQTADEPGREAIAAADDEALLEVAMRMLREGRP
ncbi:MAG TPA: type I polyketide synthase [Polyangiales bacterium]